MESAHLDAAIEAQMASSVRGGIMPPVFTSDGVKLRSHPYTTPLRYSAEAAAAVFDGVRESNPIGDLVTAQVTGVGAASAGLPGSPGVATGPDKFGRFNAVIIDVSISDNVVSSPFTFGVVGTFDHDGETWTVPNMDFAWLPEHGTTEQVVILVSEQSTPGPRPCLGRLTCSDWPNSLLKNGAPNMANGDQVTLTTVTASANTVFNLTVVTANHTSFEVLERIMKLRALDPAAVEPPKNPTMTQLITPRMAKLMGGASAKLPS